MTPPIDIVDFRDYCRHMIATLRQTKAELSRMVRMAAGGEEVLITVRGQPKSRLNGVPKAPSQKSKLKWLAELRKLRESTSTGKTGISTDQILDEIRADRD